MSLEFETLHINDDVDFPRQGIFYIIGSDWKLLTLNQFEDYRERQGDVNFPFIKIKDGVPFLNGLVRLVVRAELSTESQKEKNERRKAWTPDSNVYTKENLYKLIEKEGIDGITERSLNRTGFATLGYKKLSGLLAVLESQGLIRRMKMHTGGRPRLAYVTHEHWAAHQG